MNKTKFFDEEFFSRRTPIVAYWAGFFMADGCITQASKNSYSLVCYVSGNDEQHIREFGKEFGLDDSSFYTRKEGHFGFQVNGIGLKEQLEFWGIVPRKTYNFVAPKVNDELLPHFLRGWADGDGQIYADGQGARFTVSGNRLSLEWYGKALERLGYDKHWNIQERENNNGVLYIGGRHNTAKVIDLLLVSSNFKLDRKWNTRYDTQATLYDVVCAQCGKHFGVPKYRLDHPTFGRFCGKPCYDESQKRKIVDGAHKCARCGEIKKEEEFSANKSYCKVCWRERTQEKRRASGVKPQKVREQVTINGVLHERCPKCKNLVPKDELKSTYCKNCQSEYVRNWRSKKIE